MKSSPASADTVSSVYDDWFYEFREAAIKQDIALMFDLMYSRSPGLYKQIRRVFSNS